MFGNNKDNKVKRFNIINTEMVNLVTITVIQDTQTGVNYMLGQGSTGLGITPLIDEDGHVLITKND